MKLEQQFFVGAHDVDREKKVTNRALLEMLSDISMMHGVKSGQTKAEGKSLVSWVVVGWYVKVYKRPAMFSTLRAVTWATDYTKVRAGRDYIIYDEDDNVVVKGTSRWIAVDVDTGRPLRITSELADAFDPEPDELVFPEFSFPSIRNVDMDVAETREVEIDRTMFDYNGHVHNSVYLGIAEQILPEELYLRGFGELIITYKQEITAEDPVVLEYSHQGEDYVVVIRRKSDGAIHAVINFRKVGTTA